ncbi:leucyl/phenylalanyl-tRNA--protein transferase [Chromatium okenii]|uniref:leucyl/phenylalanyl-tRNA--protein transferase n=1 Tax=Chromatium okenii TaxID=61644 RepID=UPI0019058BDC|nr:leucyl/phenylalanyl-tRNA--protein transferase [Chromatium okenii]MBK1640360.1 leucyl/phenylalanyl-tRNA--protein transferase [Chromatium okenii]
MLTLLDPDDPAAFPDPEQALTDPNGLLAVGGELSTARLLHAYRRGIFPWFNPGDPILWWSPDPRLVLVPTQIHRSRSLTKRLRQAQFEVTIDGAFGRVIRHCAAPRTASGGTWLVPAMIAAYETLHHLGFAHSIEIWREQQLIGGLYGIALGRVFFGESMFSRASDASKIALVHLCEQLAAWDFGLIDCQMETEHLRSMGATLMSRSAFIQQLNQLCPLPGWAGKSTSLPK